MEQIEKDWLKDFMQDIQTQAKEYPVKAFLLVVEDLYYEQQEYIASRQAKLDGMSWQRDI